MGLDYDEHETYVARLDCKQAAQDGVCLMSYANTARNVYHRYGFVAEHNADISYQNGSVLPRLKLRKQVQAMAEILWPYGREMQTPTTFDEEKFARIGGSNLSNAWPFVFTRSEVIDSLVKFSMKCPGVYLRAQTLLESCKRMDKDIICHVNHIEFDASKLARCSSVPSQLERKTKKFLVILLHDIFIIEYYLPKHNLISNSTALFR
jgi:hypothetical protein